jgi:large conductance mechanosensitive channel
MWKEFKAFAMRGNVIDMAVGIIIGAAFGKIVSSLVNDLLMPPIGLLLGRIDFTALFLSLDGQSYPSIAAAKEAGAPVFAYGSFLQATVDFVIVAFAIFLLVKQVNRWSTPPPPAAPTSKDCSFCFSSIPIKATRCPHCTSTLAAG